jgi:hypothetical protein
MQTKVESLGVSGLRRQEVMERLFTDLQVERLNELYYQVRAKTSNQRDPRYRGADR